MNKPKMNTRPPGIKSTSVLKVLPATFRNPKTRKAALTLTRTIFRDFFWPQFHGAYFRGKYKLITLDHKLDRQVPFDPKLLQQYLSFFHLWIKSMGYMYTVYGRKFLPYLEKYLWDLDHLYRMAGKVYREYQSTTFRPPYPFTPYGILVRLADPHRHCFPSLHVIVVLFNYHKLLQFSGLLENGERLAIEINYAYDQALRITESVLLVKQHSVYCISGSLFFLTCLVDGFSRQQADKIIADLCNHILAESEIKKELVAEISAQYKQFCKKADDGCGECDVLIEFLSGKHGK